VKSGSVDGFLFFVLIIGVIACGTVTPKHVKASQAAFDPSTGAQNGGFVCWTNYPVAHSSIWSESAVARYNALAVKWGTQPQFVPPIKPWEGIAMELDGKTTTNYIFTPSGLVNFIELSDVQRQNLK
jgi:hypothetical protein